MCARSMEEEVCWAGVRIPGRIDVCILTVAFFFIVIYSAYLYKYDWVSNSLISSAFSSFLGGGRGGKVEFTFLCFQFLCTMAWQVWSHS